MGYHEYEADGELDAALQRPSRLTYAAAIANSLSVLVALALTISVGMSDGVKESALLAASPLLLGAVQLGLLAPLSWIAGGDDYRGESMRALLAITLGLGLVLSLVATFEVYAQLVQH